jgi:uncharacterized protein (DUF1697 family)
MRYVALLRGINVGGNKKVEMKKLAALFETLDCENVSTYINSGNVVFESKKSKATLCLELGKALKKEFGFEIPILVKTRSEMEKIAAAIPHDWKNDTAQRTDVAYLFGKIDSPKIVFALPFNRDFVDVRYVKGAVIWNIARKNYTKSRLNKLIGSEIYRFMTMRNVNTAKVLAGLQK